MDTGEECDDGPANSDEVPDACRTTCAEPLCGDGVVDVQQGENCDDGNLDPGDLCGPTCQTEVCGNFSCDAPETCTDCPGDCC